MASDNDKKDRVRRALESYASRDWREIQKQSGLIQKRKNSKPEKEVEKECMEWMRQMGWSMQVIEAKATYSPAAGRYISQSTKAGTLDSFGSIPDGTSAHVEFKAPGRLNTFRAEKNYRQQQYAIEKIKMNSFVAVVDSKDRLISIYNEWSKKRSIDQVDARNYLLDQLP